MRGRRTFIVILIVTTLPLLLDLTDPVAAVATQDSHYAITDLGILGGGVTWWGRWDWSSAVAINSRGQVVGTSSTTGGPAEHRAFQWQASTGMQSLGTLDGAWRSSATVINERGQVVGYSDTPRLRSQHAFLWQSGTGMQDLGRSEVENSYPSDINERGQVVGYRVFDLFEGNLTAGAFLWQTGSGMRDVGTLGGDWSSAVAINDRGQVIGSSTTATGQTHAFLWHTETGMRDLGTLGGANSAASDINERGQVVGNSTTATGHTHAFVWLRGTGMRDLGTLGGDWSTAVRVNERGQVIGNSTTASGHTHAFVWHEDTGMHDVGSLGGNSSAVAINQRGQIVGEADVVTDFGPLYPQPHAFVWQADTGIRDLGTLGGRTSGATAINDRGQIVGYATTTEDKRHAVLWQDATPPEITPSITGIQSSDGWYRSDVTVSWNVNDSESGITSSSGCSTTTLTTETRGTKLTCSATNGVGLSASQAVTVKLDKTPPVTTTSLIGLAGNDGWYRGRVTLRLVATDNLSGVSSTSYSTDAGATWLTYDPASPPVFTKDGQYVVQFRSTDKAGNVETPAKSLNIKVDQTPPMVTCAASPTTLWPPNHQLRPVTTSLMVQDAGSGPAGFVLTSVTSNEPDTGFGAGDTPGDIQGWILGTPSTTGQLRAERSGSGTGRVYTLSYAGADQAGNVGMCEVVVTVPHDQSR